MAGRTLGEQQEVNRQLQLLERLTIAVESCAEHLQQMAVNSAMTNDALLALAGAINPEYMDDTLQTTPGGRHYVNVELPPEDAVLCQRCQTVRPQDPHHPGHPEPHDCRPWVSPTEQPGIEETADWERPDQRRERLHQQFDSKDRSAAGDPGHGWSTRIEPSVPERDMGSVAGDS